MRELTLTAEPQLLRMAIEPTERLPVSIDLAARLDVAETLLSAEANDNGRNIASNVSVDGSVVTLDVGGLANGSVSLIYITAAGSAGSSLRFVLLLQSVDPAARVAEEVIDPTTVLTWRGAYLPGSVYAYLDVVIADNTTWVALLDAPTAAPGEVEGEWQALSSGSDPTSSPEFADLNITTLATDSFFGNVAKSVLSWINTFTAWLKAMLTDAGRDTGFVSQDGVISLPSATQLQMNAGQVFYRKGKKTTTTENELITVTTASGNSYIGRAAADGALVSSGSVWTLADYLSGFCSVAITHGFNNHLIGLEERHNYGRDIRRHNNDHHGRGAFINPAGFIRTAPSAASPATLSLSSGTLFDEDIQTTVAPATTVRRWWRAVGGASVERDTVTSLDPRLMNGNLIRWDNNGTLTDGATGKYYPYFIYVSPEKWASSGGTTGIYVVVAQGEYASAAAAKAAPRPTLPGFPTNELVLLYVIPYKQANVNSVTLADADIVDWRASQLGGSAATGTFSAVASAISVDASGFDGNLTPADTNLQLVAQKVDDLVLGGGGGAELIEDSGDFVSISSWSSAALPVLDADEEFFVHLRATQTLPDVVSLKINNYEASNKYGSQRSSASTIISLSTLIALTAAASHEDVEIKLTVSRFPTSGRPRVHFETFGNTLSGTSGSIYYGDAMLFANEAPSILTFFVATNSYSGRIRIYKRKVQ